jgi:DNA-binding beta-propeller fold protein YncE
MGGDSRFLKVMSSVLLLATAVLASCQPAGDSAAVPMASGERWSYHDWPTGPYRVVEDWPKPLPDDRHSHEGWTWGSFGGVYAETPDRVWIAMRGELPLQPGMEPWQAYGAVPGGPNAQPNSDGISATCQPATPRGWERRFEHSIFIVDGEGYMIDEWPHLDPMFAAQRCGRGPHQIKMSPYDQEKHVWIIDDQLHVIYVFTYEGELVRTHGELGVQGRGPNTFDRPTDVAWLPDGTYFISDGYGGTRVAKFDPEGNFIMDWGQAPVDRANPGPNEWNTVHSIAISDDRKLFVLDRGHRRMQVFDENGTFLDMWPLNSPHWPASQNNLFVNHFIDTDGYLWVADAPTSRVIKFDQNGNYLYSWGAPGPQPGRLNCSHGMTTDQESNLYIADCFAGRVQKFEPIPGADPSKIAGQILRQYPLP